MKQGNRNHVTSATGGAEKGRTRVDKRGCGGGSKGENRRKRTRAARQLIDKVGGERLGFEGKRPEKR